MTGQSPWDLVVIGGGSAGLIAARTARLLGATVALVERSRLGGDCLWTGCVPSKALISRAREYEAVRRLTGTVFPRADDDAIFEAVDTARDRLAPADSEASLTRDGVTVIRGDARFTGPRTLQVDERRIDFSRVVVATGSFPLTPQIPGLEGCVPLTSDTLWDLRRLPGRILVIGGGPIGCELGQALARLGSTVTLVQRNAALLPHEHPSARSLVLKAMVADGVNVFLGRGVERVEARGGGAGEAFLDDGTRISFDRVLVAAGRKPRVDDLSLAAAGIDQNPAGYIRGDQTLKTSNPAVWVAGDVGTLPKHTHTAGVSGSIAARNALLGSRKRMRIAGEPRVIFTSPEIAAVGVQSLDRVRRRGGRIVTVQHRQMDRAVTEDDTAGFTQVVIGRRGRLLGGTIVGPRAGESIGELVLAVHARMSVSKLASATHPYPTFNDGLWNAAIADSQRRIREGAAGRAAGLLVRWKRGRTPRAHRVGDRMEGPPA